MKDKTWVWSQNYLCVHHYKNSKSKLSCIITAMCEHIAICILNVTACDILLKFVVPPQFSPLIVFMIYYRQMHTYTLWNISRTEKSKSQISIGFPSSPKESIKSQTSATDVLTKKKEERKKMNERKEEEMQGKYCFIFKTKLKKTFFFCG